MIRWVFSLTLALTAVAAAAPSLAFWQRSQASHCNDATTETERLRHRCDELRAYADPGWPALGLGGAAYGVPRYGAPETGPWPAGRRPTRRLG
jgi:hypothetical protein